MDALTDYTSLAQLPSSEVHLTSSIFGELYKRLEDFLAQFHNDDFVHGDIRDHW